MRGKKLISLVLSVLLALGAAMPLALADDAADVGATSQAAMMKEIAAMMPDDIQLPLTDTPVTLTYWWPWEPDVQKMVTTVADTLTAQVMEELTGVHIEYIHPPIGQESEAFSVMLASGDLPDMIYFSNNVKYPGGGVAGVDDGVLLQLNDLIEKSAPNYTFWRNYTEDHRRQTITDDGIIWGMAMLNAIAEPANIGMCVRQDKLDQLGMEAPRTLDEMHEVLKAAKEKLGMESPLLLPSSGVYMDSEILSAFGVGREFYVDGEAVKFGPMQQGYKEYLEMMNQWYAEGLIDKNFVSRENFTDAPPNDLLVSEDAMMMATYWGRTIDCMVKRGLTKNEDFWLQAIQAPVQEAGQTVQIRKVNYPIMDQTAVTSSCKDPELAVKWLDFQFTYQAMLLNNYGVEGTTYDFVDGAPVFSDLIMNNPDMNSTDAMRKYVRRNGTGWIDYTRQWQTNANPASTQSYYVWDKDGIDQILPPVSLTTEEANEYQSLYADIQTYVQEMTVSFILGTTSLDTFDSFVSQLEKMNIGRVLEIQQAAYDRYMAR